MEDKVKIVFEFGRKEFDLAMLLAANNTSRNEKRVWDFMTKGELLVTSDMISQIFGISSREVDLAFVAMAVSVAQVQMGKNDNGNN